MLDGGAEVFVFYPVVGKCYAGLKASGNFVFALGAAVEVFELVLDGVVYALVVAGFEMQEWKFFCAAPIAAVDCVGIFYKK